MKKITIVISVLAVLALVASPVRAAVYNFQFQPPNTAQDPSTGNVIQISGGGQLTPTVALLTRTDLSPSSTPAARQSPAATGSPLISLASRPTAARAPVSRLVNLRSR